MTETADAAPPSFQNRCDGTELQQRHSHEPLCEEDKTVPVDENRWEKLTKSMYGTRRQRHTTGTQK